VTLMQSFFRKASSKILGIPANRFHPLVWILGEPLIGKNVYIGGFSEVNASKSSVSIGDDCDIASFVSINTADSHLLTIGVSYSISRKGIVIGNRVFIGSHSVIKGGAVIGNNTVIAAGTIVEGVEIPPYSLVYGNPMTIKAGYYLGRSK
jgi:acetyltransferase-like isoleucine patch superfamily enzyme